MANLPFDKLFEGVKPSEVIQNVGDTAAIWASYSPLLQEINAYLITRYCMTQTFTPDELQAYRKGLVDLELFLHSALEEVKSLKASNEN